MATIKTAVDIDIKVDGQATVQQAAAAYEDLGDAVAKTQLEAEKLAQQFGINDARTQEAIKVAAKYKSQMEQLDFAIDGAKGGTETLFRATQGILGGFEAAAGAAALFGVESEDLQKTLVRLQAAMVLSQGLKDFREFLPAIRDIAESVRKQLIPAFNSLRGALIATGWGAAAVAVGYLLVQLDKYVGASREAAKKQEELNQQIADSNKKLAEQRTTVEVLNRIVQDTTINEGKRKQALEELVKLIPSLNEVQLDQADSLTLINNEVEKYIKNADKQIRIDVLRQQAITKLNEKFALQAELEQTLSKLRLATGDEFDELKKEYELLALRVSEANGEYNDILDKIADVTSEMEVQVPVVQKLKKEVKETTDEFKEAREAIARFLLLLKRQDVKEFQKMLDEMKKSLKSSEMSVDDVKDSLEELADLMIEMPTGVDYDRFQKAQLFVKAYSAQIVSDLIEAMEATSALMDAFASDDEERQRKAFQLNKAAAIAKTTMSTIEATQYAFETAQKNPLNEFTGGGYAIVRAATALAFGVAQIKKIQSTQFKTASPGGLAGTGVQQYPAPRAFQTSSLGQDFTGQTKVYVTEGDITRTINRRQANQRVSVIGG